MEFIFCSHIDTHQEKNINLNLIEIIKNLISFNLYWYVLRILFTSDLLKKLNVPVKITGLESSDMAKWLQQGLWGWKPYGMSKPFW